MKSTWRIFPIHTAVKGRVRFQVGGLKYNHKLRRFLELQLKSQSNISLAQASPTTGTVLILFSSELALEQLAQQIREIVALFHASPPDLSNTTLPDASIWHFLSADKVVSALISSATAGISRDEALFRRRACGPNLVIQTAQRSGLQIFTAQFKTLPVLLLTVSAGLSLATGGLVEAAVIFAVIISNAYIGYAMEASSERTLNLLSASGPSEALVIRDGTASTIAIQDIVPGDLISLVSGSYVPADARVLYASGLTVDESALTGESALVLKHAESLSSVSVALGDRLNMVYRGTIVTGGKGLCIVVATGEQTEIGKIQLLVSDTRRSDTPLQTQMEHLSRQLVSLSGLVGVGLFTAGLLRGFSVFEMLNISIALVIAAVPEGLPTVATTTLTQSARKMRKRNVVVRNLDAIETLGATQIICLDKTGTLTMNHMTAVSVFTGMRSFSAEDLAHHASDNTDLLRLMQIASLCNETEIKSKDAGGTTLAGSPTEVALIEMALGSGIDVLALRKQYPVFETEYRSEGKPYMVTQHQSDGDSVLIAVKGSPLSVLNLCGSLSKPAKQAIEEENRRMASSALRVLAIAYSEGPMRGGAKKKLKFLGLVGLQDVPRPSVGKFIQSVHQAGIKTVMITGDQAETAYALAQQFGISGEEPLQVFDASQLQMSKVDELKEIASRTHVFARVSPADKLLIVQALKAAGKTVAMVGDGINDAPALKAADVGIAMGSHGTDVAREVANLVLLDDDLQSLTTAVELGRATHDAIRKSVVYLLTTNLSETLLMSISVVAGMGQPLNPIQLLWINLVSDVFPALALAMEAPEADILKRRPREQSEAIIHKPEFKRIGVESAAMTVTSLGVYGYAIAKYGIGPRAQSMAFTGLAASQLLHTLSSRSDSRTLFGGKKLPSNPYIPISVGVGFGLQALATQNPTVRRLLGATRLSGTDLLVCGGATLVNYLFNEIGREIKRRKGELGSANKPSSCL